jgi:hypothetical protein
MKVLNIILFYLPNKYLILKGKIISMNLIFEFCNASFDDLRNLRLGRVDVGGHAAGAVDHEDEISV